MFIILFPCEVFGKLLSACRGEFLVPGYVVEPPMRKFGDSDVSTALLLNYESRGETSGELLLVNDCRGFGLF